LTVLYVPDSPNLALTVLYNQISPGLDCLIYARFADLELVGVAREADEDEFRVLALVRKKP